jgi:nitrate/TMAO reductase-like tetraheme cytochrome c subunit
MRRIRRWLPLLLVSLLLLGAVTFGAGVVVTDYLEQNNTFCTACHLHEKKFTEFHLVEGKHITLAAAHNIAGVKNVKCIDCHIGATVHDKMVVKAIAARDTVAYFLGAFEEPTHLRYALGNRTCLKCHHTGGQNPEQEKAFHNDPYHAKLPLICYECHTVHPVASVETRFLQRQIVQPLCDDCHRRGEQ